MLSKGQLWYVKELFKFDIGGCTIAEDISCWWSVLTAEIVLVVIAFLSVGGVFTARPYA